MSTGRNGIKQSKEYLNKSDISKPGEKKHGEHVKDETHGYEKGKGAHHPFKWDSKQNVLVTISGKCCSQIHLLMSQVDVNKTSGIDLKCREKKNLFLLHVKKIA